MSPMENAAPLPARVIVYPLVYMTLCIAVWLLSRKELPLIIALTYRTLHASNVSFKLVSSCDPPWFRLVRAG